MKLEVFYDKSGKIKIIIIINNFIYGLFKMYSVMLEIVLIDNKSLLYILFKVYKFIIIFDKDKLFKGKDGKVNVFFFFEFDFGLFGL